MAAGAGGRRDQDGRRVRAGARAVATVGGPQESEWNTMVQSPNGSGCVRAVGKGR